MAYGTLTTLDTLASLRASTGLVVDIGEDVAWESIQAALDAHNQLLQESLTGFVDMTTDQLRRYAGPDNMVMEELGEFGTPGAQKIAAGVTLGFPLKLFGGGLQWTRTALQNMLASELAAQATAMLNADSAPIPIAPDGSTFNGATHTHYLGTASFAAADLTSLVNTVIEHFLTGGIQVLANAAQETAIRGFSGFNPYYDPRLIPSVNQTNAMGDLDVMNITNRAIGVFGAAEVWIKPWIPANYVVAVLVGSPQKALAMRTRMAGGGQLNLEFENEIWPLRSKGYSREFGFGVWNRVAAACLLTNNATYSAPAKNLDEIEQGGRFRNSAGKLVNAEGQRIHEDGTLLSPDELAAEV